MHVFEARYWQRHFGAGLQLVGFYEGYPMWMGARENWDQEKKLEVSCDCNE